MKNKKGYKNTKLGWIPVEWILLEFGGFTERRKNKFKPNLTEARKCVELEHINQKIGSLNGFVNSTQQKSTKNVFFSGDVLFGKLRPYLRKFWLANFDGVCSSEIWVLKGNQKLCRNEFLFFFVQHSKFIEIANITSGSKMPRADWNYVRNFPFLLPPTQEQKKIAKILTTWDTAIDKLSQLIEAKEEQKKGLMQRLLSGDVRLEGFSGEWEVVRLGDIANISKGKQLNKILLTKTGKNPSYSGGISPSGFTDKWNTAAETIIISEGGNSCGYVNFIMQNFWLGGHCYAIKNHEAKTEKPFLFQVLKYNQRNIMRLRVGSGLPNIQKKDIVNYKIMVPRREEQVAISNILSRGDEEIKVLKSKLVLFRTQKKGLMQQLLTGKTRV